MTLHNKQTHDRGSCPIPFTFASAAVQSHTIGLLRAGLRLKEYGTCRPISTLLAVLQQEAERGWVLDISGHCSHPRAEALGTETTP